MYVLVIQGETDQIQERREVPRVLRPAGEVHPTHNPMKNGKALKQKPTAKTGGWIPVAKKMHFRCNVCLNVQNVSFRVRNKDVALRLD